MPEKIKKQEGQSMIEYMIIVMLVALSSILVFSLLGQTVRGQGAEMSIQISGGQAQAAHLEVAGPGGGGRHCCGVRVNPPAPIENSPHHG